MKNLIFVFFIFSSSLVYTQEALTVEQFLSTVKANQLRNEGKEFIITGVVQNILSGPALHTISLVGLTLFSDLNLIKLEELIKIEPNDILTLSGTYNNSKLSNVKIVKYEKSSRPFQFKEEYTAIEFANDILYKRSINAHKRDFIITGIISSIENFNNGFAVGLKAIETIYCYFDLSYYNYLLNLNSGDSIKLKGTFILYGGRFLNLNTFDNCVIIQEE